MTEVATVWGRELRALYNIGVAKGLDCWGPVVNLARDPRVSHQSVQSTKLLAHTL